jgi:hypothetical protein
LSFFKIETVDKRQNLSFGKNSWCHSYSLFPSDLITRYTSAFENPSESNEKSTFRLPFFQKDSCGLSGNTSLPGEILISTEMSASQLSDLALCSKFFYYKHLLKITEESLEALSPVLLSLPPNQQKKYLSVVKGVDKENEESSFKSSAERGTKVHWIIENYINGVDVTNSTLDVHDTEAFSYAKEELNNYLSNPEFNLISERDLKFDLFTQKISSKPDLIIENVKNRLSVEILDFKTGDRDPVIEKKYIMQLLIYASGYSQLYPEAQEFVLKSVYLDQKETATLKFSKSEMNDHLSRLLSGFNNFESENVNYCKKCEFNKICLVGHS